MVVQRMSDIAISLVLLLLCLPVLFLVSLVLAIEQSRIPIQSADRLTRDGRVIRVYGLRVSDATPFEQRPTVGGALVRRLHLDYIPVLVNVLKGDLTLVGPGRDLMALPRGLAERPFS